ncbi:MAG: hypothetical protein OXN17_04860 [Candidatus Poribacteria bacterium]|nr:hypothetical protein [Candidatus Poribacteria bacterium]MDE0503599.1 hypothetical protein [Candidatus Poribacteria bacterium]
MLTRISSTVHMWSEIHGAARNEPYLWNSYLIQVKDRDILILVDPLPLSDEEIREVEEIGEPTHIILTCNWHLRESLAFKHKWECEVLLYENHAGQAEIEFDCTFQDRDVLWGLVEVIRVPDVRHREEVGFYLKSDGVLIVGDLMSGGRKDCGIPDGELGFKDPAYLVDLAHARRSLKSLLHLEFNALCFGHGTPIRSGAKDVLRRFVECDTTWEELGRRREEGFRLNPELRDLHRT